MYMSCCGRLCLVVASGSASMRAIVALELASWPGATTDIFGDVPSPVSRLYFRSINACRIQIAANSVFCESAYPRMRSSVDDSTSTSRMGPD